MTNLLIIIIIGVAYGQFLIQSSVPGKYISIKMPSLYNSNKFTSLKQKRIDYIVFYPSKTPKLYLQYQEGSSDFCNYPNILNNDLWKNGTFCQKNFCEGNNEIFQRFNESLTSNNQTEINLAILMFYSSYYSCSKCLIGMNQTYLNGSFENCFNEENFFPNDKYCNETFIFGHQTKSRLCYYSSLDMFINSDIDFEIVVTFFSFNIFPPLGFFFIIILIPFTILFVLLPYSFEIFKHMKNQMISFHSKLRILFSPQSFMLLFLFGIEIIIPIILLLDMTTTFHLFESFIIVGYIFMTLIYIFLTTLFLQISQSRMYNIEDPPQRSQMIFFTSFLTFTIILGLFVLITYLVGTFTFNFIAYIVYDIFLYFAIFLLFFLGLILFISSLVIYIKLKYISSVDFVKLKVNYSFNCLV